MSKAGLRSVHFIYQESLNRWTFQQVQEVQSQDRNVSLADLSL